MHAMLDYVQIEICTEASSSSTRYSSPTAMEVVGVTRDVAHGGRPFQPRWSSAASWTNQMHSFSIFLTTPPPPHSASHVLPHHLGFLHFRLPSIFGAASATPNGERPSTPSTSTAESRCPAPLTPSSLVFHTPMTSAKAQQPTGFARGTESGSRVAGDVVSGDVAFIIRLWARRIAVDAGRCGPGGR